MRRRTWLFRTLVLGALGLALLLAGFVYGVVMVGVPYQDPTPEMARREAFHLDVSGWGMAIGGCIVLLSIVVALSVLVFRCITKSRVG